MASVDGRACTLRQWDERSHRGHDLLDADGAPQYSIPRPLRRVDGRASEENRARILMSLAKSGEPRQPTGAERRLIDDDDSYGAAVGDDRTDQLRLGDTAGADRVIADFAERGTKQGTPPLFRHYDQHARGKRCHDRPLSRQPTRDLERVLGVHLLQD